MRTILLAGMLAMLTIRSYAADVPCASATGRTVSVNGSAAVRLPPDRVEFTVGVETVDGDAAKAFAVNEAKLRAMIASLKAKGVAAKDIQTSNLDISSRDEQGERVPGFRVANHVTVTSDDPSRAGELLQAAVAAGANQASGLHFSVADPSKTRARGLELAFHDARSKAEALAQLSKKPLGDVICVAEAPSWWSAGLTNNAIALEGYKVARTEAGSEEVSFSVSVVFELK